MTTEKICNRCDEPHGDIVTLNNKEEVCGACIVSMGQLARVAECVTLDMTPSSECIACIA